MITESQKGEIRQRFVARAEEDDLWLGQVQTVGAQNMLALRAEYLSNRWDEAWQLTLAA